MATLESLRACKLEYLAQVVSRPSMMAVGTQAITTLFVVLLYDLLYIDERTEEVPDWFTQTVTRFGSVGPPAMDDWFVGLAHHCTSEVASVWAEVASRFGYLKLDHLASAEEWSGLCLDDPTKCTSRDWKMSEFLVEFSAPSLIVGQEVLCYAPSDGGSWAFFDFYKWPPWASDPMLRERAETCSPRPRWTRIHALRCSVPAALPGN